METDMVVIRYGQDKMLSRDNGNFLKTNMWKLRFKKMKKYIEIWRQFVLSDGLVLGFENGLSQCG